MMRRLFITACSLLATTTFAADQPTAAASVAAVAAANSNQTQPEPAQSTPKADAGPKALSGMSILGNQEAPKALVIVPWKSSQLGDTLGIGKTLDDGRQPVDKEVFMRQLSYYEIRANAK
ncbi:hypothetical protein [Peristeroidobacter agariperforans]|uniref:hypothetical protein n=1 Tax=Peristeroidobacter agariperforans TaxID=268404 RepID=UPI00101B881C|nr:hypothetical protein [Peristeroidobacter agariperforans]